MKREVLIWPDSVLRRRSTPVPVVDDSVRQLLSDLAETMVAVGGAGLAAPQIGISQRAIVLLTEQLDPQPDLPITNKKYAVVKLVNPVIVDRSDAKVEVEEACLSIPGVKFNTRRHVSVRVEALDENGHRIELSGDGQLSLALQHEIDHLDGRVLADTMSPLKRSLLAKKMTKAKANGMKYIFPAPEAQDFTAVPEAKE